MTEPLAKADAAVEGGAAKLDRLSRKAEAKGGVAAKLADMLADDAAFLRRLKPSLMAARARGVAPTNLPPGSAPRAPSRPQLGARPSGETGRRSPLVIVGAAFATGIALAKVIDWRGHAHPRR